MPQETCADGRPSILVRVWLSGGQNNVKWLVQNAQEWLVCLHCSLLLDLESDMNLDLFSVGIPYITLYLS